MTGSEKPKLSLAEYFNAVMRFSLPPHFVPVCDALDDPRIPFTMVISGPGNGKSTVTSQAFPAKLLGEDPATTILGVSAAENLMQGFMSAVAQTVEHNPNYHALYSAVRPDKSLGWSGDRGLFVTGHLRGDPDASFFGAGLASKALIGKHARIILLDDIHDEENSSTPDACAKVTAFFFKHLIGRGDPRGARYILSGRRFQESDAYGSLMSSGEWVVMVLPAERPESTELWWDVCVPRSLQCVFSERYAESPDRPGWLDWDCAYYRVVYGFDPLGQGFFWPEMTSKRREYFYVKRSSPAEAEAVYQCNPRARAEAPFRDSDFCTWEDVSWQELRLGRSSPEVEGFIRAMGGLVVQSWDTAYGKSPDSAYSACITALLYPSRTWWRGEDPAESGECERHYRVYVLDAWRGKVASSMLNQEVRRQHRKWRPRTVLIEEKASGITLLQTLKQSEIAVKAVKVVEGKLERALDAVGGGAGSVQGWFRQHRVPLPQGAPWVKDYIQEFKQWSGTRAVGVKDRFDATVHLVAYAIGLGVKAARLPSLEARQGDPADMSAEVLQRDPRAQALAAIAVLGRQAMADPFDGMCGRCTEWDGRAGAPFCRLHRMAKIALDTCGDWRSMDAVVVEEEAF